MVFADAAPEYRRHGWPVFPLPPGKKFPPPCGRTGADGVDLTDAEVAEVRQSRPDANIGIRAPDGVIGLDVDQYADKHGATELARLADELGPLPDTWISSARNPQATGSGIRWFRVPPGIRFPGQVGACIEVVQRTHRYAVAPPSVHPNGDAYTWYKPNGFGLLQAADRIPAVAELPELPAAWVARFALDGDAPTKAHVTDADVAAFLDRANGEPCLTVRARLASALRELEESGSRHESATRDTLALLGLATDGHSGVAEAIEEYREVFLAELSGDRGETAAAAEFERMIRGGVAILAGTEWEDPCGCGIPFASVPDADGPATTPPEPEAAEDLPFEERFREEIQKEGHRVAVRRLAEAAASDLLYGAMEPKAPVSAWERAKRAGNHKMRWLIPDLIPADATVALVAEKKAGKTTLTHKLCSAVLTGGEFLTFQANKVDGSVVLYDLEMSDPMLDVWLKRNGATQSNLHVVSLRGEAQYVNASSREYRTKWARQLRELNCKMLVIDPLGPLFRSMGLDENTTQVGTAVDHLLALKNEAQVDVLVVTLHAGHGDKGRARGSSVLADTPDVNLSLRKSQNDVSRVFSAEGRDVNVDSIGFVYDLETGSITIEEDSPAVNESRDGDVRALLEILRDNEGIGARQLRERMRTSLHGCSQSRTDRAVELACAEGFVRIDDGGGRKAHFLTDEGREMVTESD